MNPPQKGILTGGEEMEKDQTPARRPEDMLAWALEKNAAARAVYLAMDDRDRAALLRRARAIGDQRAMDGFVDALLGWREGHPPYQL